MEVLTSTFLLISNENDDLEEPLLSMWQVTTQTLCLLEEILELGGTMRQKMDKLSQEDLSARPTGLMEIRLVELQLSWLNLCPSKTLTNFGQLFKHWLQDYCYEISPVLTHMHLGDSDQESRNMKRRAQFASMILDFQSFLNGNEKTCLEIRA